MKKKWRWYLGVLLTMLFLTAVPAYGGTGEIQGLSQTGAGQKAIELSWKRPEGAVYYEIAVSDCGRDAYTLQKSVYSSLSRVRTSVPVPDAGSYYDIRLTAYDEDGRTAGEGGLSRCPSLPGKVTGIRQKSLYTQRHMKLNWDRQEAAAGYEVELYLDSMGTRSVRRAASTYCTVAMEQDQLYRIRIRGYVQLKTGGKTKKLYGPYGTVYTSLQPRLSFQGRDRHSVTVNWKPVEGADSYAVFVSRKQKSGYQRVDIVRSASAVIRNLEPDTRYYILIRMNKRVDGVLYRSPSTYVYPVRIDTGSASAGSGNGFVAA